MRLTILFLMLFNLLVSYSQEVVFQKLDEEYGLLSGDVYKVIQDKKGYLWFASSSGVSRYDGRNFKEFTVDDGLTDYEVLSLYEDSTGRIWFETFNGKPCFYLNGKVHNPSNNELLSKIKADYFIKETYEENPYRYWINYGPYSYVLDFKENSIQRFDKRTAFFVKNAKGEVLIYSGENHYYNTVTNETSYIEEFYRNEFQMNNTGDNLSLRNGDIMHVRPFNEFFIKRKDSFQMEYVPSYLSENFQKKLKIINLYQGKNGQICISTNDGLFIFDNPSPETLGKPPIHIFEGKTITSSLYDHQNNLWVTSTDGVYKVINDISIIGGVTDHVVSFDFNDNYLLAVTQNKEAHLIAIKSGEKMLQTVVDSKPRKIKQFGNDFYLICNLGGYRFSGLNVQRVFETLSLKDLEYAGDHYYLADAGGLEKIHKDSNIRGYFIRKKNPQIKQLFEERVYALKKIDSVMYISAKKGLFRLKDEQVYPLLNSEKAYEHRIIDIVFFQDYIMLGTQGNGVYIYKNNELITILNVSNGLLSNEVKNFFIENNRLYVVTRKGIQKVNQNLIIEKKSLLNSQDIIINKALVIDNNLIMASSKGLLSKKFINYSNESSTLKSEIFLKNGTENISKGSHIPFDKKSIEFHFKLFDFNNSNTSYEYRIKETSEDWKTTFSNIVSYERLDPGDYTFELRANSNYIDAFPFSVDAPFWNLWWFRVMMLLVFMSALAFIYRYLLNRKVKKADEQYRIQLLLASAEQDALRAQMNPHFIFNSLNSIQSLILQNNTDRAYQYLGSFSKLVRKVLQDSRNIDTTLQNELDFLSLYLELEKLRFESKFSYTIDVKGNVNPEETIPSMVIQPLIENSIIHGLVPSTNKRNILKVTFEDSEEYIHCIVDDNGVGRKFHQGKPSKKKSSLGIKIIQERLNLYDFSQQSKVYIEDKNKGTKATIKIRKDVKSSNR